MKTYTAALAALLSLVLSGCFLNPYRSKSNCPETYQGECISVRSAYDKSLENGGSKPRGKTLKEEAQGKKSGKKNAVSAENEYREALYNRLSGLIREPAAPVVAPPQVMRVLVLPYGGESGRLFEQRFVYFFLDGPRFILDESSFDDKEFDLP